MDIREKYLELCEQDDSFAVKEDSLTTQLESVKTVRLEIKHRKRALLELIELIEKESEEKNEDNTD